MHDYFARLQLTTSNPAYACLTLSAVQGAAEHACLLFAGCSSAVVDR